MIWAVNIFKSLKSPGPDGICSISLQEGLNFLIRYSINVYSSSLVMDHIPKLWRDVREVIIPKPGRECSLAKSYHPISLLFSAQKIYDRLLDDS